MKAPTFLFIFKKIITSVDGQSWSYEGGDQLVHCLVIHHLPIIIIYHCITSTMAAKGTKSRLAETAKIMAMVNIMVLR